jgi:hypothetical protein
MVTSWMQLNGTSEVFVAAIASSVVFGVLNRIVLQINEVAAISQWLMSRASQVMSR